MLQSKSGAASKARWLAGCSAALVFVAAPGTATAQSTTSAGADDAASPQASEGAGDIVVTGSRIDRPGFESPTPLLRLTQEDLQIVTRTNIGAALADLPQFKAATSPQTSSTNTEAGRFPINIRGLGDRRSLILLDGRRLVSDDLNTVPSIMVPLRPGVRMRSPAW